MQKYEIRLVQLLSNVKSWNDLFLLLKEEDFSGKIFEIFCKYYFLFEPTVKEDYTNIWLFDEIPTNIKQQLGFKNVEHGVDLLLKTIDNELIAVQCKFRSNENLKLSWSGDKLANLFAYADKADRYFIFTNVADIDEVSESKKVSLFNISYLLDIEESTFSQIAAEINKSKFEVIQKFEPREHQIDAIESCLKGFQTSDRGQLILPCGAGKSLTALWIKEGLKAKNTLVLVPSLALLRQIKEDWARQRRTLYHYLCVCSETDIDNASNDSFVTHTYELGSRVTTDPLIIRRFLEKDFEKIIFSTYQSLPQIVAAMKGTNLNFDFVICDEAHKTAGVHQGLFGFIHDNKKIAAKKRLYMTATPRIVSDAIKKRLEDEFQLSYDMSNPNIFGFEFYRMTFKDAIEKGILVDYKIITIGVTREDLAEYIKDRRLISDKVSIDEIANNYALNLVMKRYNATHAITFHSQVKYAEDFSERHKRMYQNIDAFHVSGTQSTSYRSVQMNGFRTSKNAIISNARCLTEGVDVPAIDLVYFCDPKNSKVDIIQATGRALRQDKKKGKQLGYIVVPIFHTKHKEVENAIGKSTFKNLISVVRALCDQDERLEVEINMLAIGKGQSSILSKLDIVLGENNEDEARLHFIGFEDLLRNSLFSQVVSKNVTAWDLVFEKFKYHLVQNDIKYPMRVDDIEIYTWVHHQRRAKKEGRLVQERVEKLNEINFVWDAKDIDLKWLDKYEQTKAFINQYGEEPKSKELAPWFRAQKTALNADRLSDYEKENIEYLINQIEQKQLKKWDIQLNITSRNDELPLKKPINYGKWSKIFNNLKEYKFQNPNKKWPDAKNENIEIRKLGIWCLTMRQRYRKDTLEEYWIDKLLEIGFNFDGKHDYWLETYNELKEYILEYQRLPDLGTNLYHWAQRHNKAENLSDVQQKLIDELNLSNYFNKPKIWNDYYEDVKAFWELSGKLPTKSSEVQLANWLIKQRELYKKGELHSKQIEQLEQLNIVWDNNEAIIDKWKENFEKIKAFKIENDKLPSFSSEGEEKRLYNWCQGQRQRRAGTASSGKTQQLGQWQLDLLNSIDFGFDYKEKMKDKWEENYQELLALYQEKGVIFIPQKIEDKINPLYRWITNQKTAFKKGSIKQEKVEKLKEIGII